MKSGQRLWTTDELRALVFLYLNTPFGKIDAKNQVVNFAANKLGRTPNAVALKMANFAHLDPTLEQQGASNVSKLDREIWAALLENWNEELVKSMQQFQRIIGADKIWLNETGLTMSRRSVEEETERSKVLSVRTKQSIFRNVILSNFNFRCCMTGLEVPELLTASHIIPWAKDRSTRLDPQNGLCLNSLHDRAFDRGLISVDKGYRIILSRNLAGRKSKFARSSFSQIDGRLITPPTDFCQAKIILPTIERRFSFHE